MKQKLYFLMGMLFIVSTSFSQTATHLNFDGTNDNVTVLDNADFDFTTKYTVETMVKLDNVSGQQTVISKFDDDANNRSWFISFGEHGGGALAVVMTSNGAWTNPLSWNSGFVPVAGTWYHIAVVFDSALASNQVKLYVNGSLYSQVTWNFILMPTTANVYIGGYDGSGNGLNTGANSRFLDGNLEDLRIWNTARTIEQINGSKNCELQGDETGLVAYYQFNQGIASGTNTSITTLNEATANANNGTLTGFALTGATSNFLAGSPVTTGSIVPSNATVTTPVTYNQGATASTLTATTGTNGTGLLWYTVATGGTGSATAPTPITTSPGNTSYWVASTNANGCESARTAIVVTVNAVASSGCWAKISTGYSHTLAIAQNGTLWAWGYNVFGQLGDGTTASKIIPTQIGTATTWSAITAGNHHNLAIQTNGTLWAWGYNDQSQLGDGTTVDKTIPTQIGTATTWSSITAGANHSLAIQTDGTLWAWGFNGDGELGDGTTANKTIPTQIGTATTWSSITAGADHSLAIQTDGTLWAWGYNVFGQLGDGTTASKTIPTQIGTATTWSSITPGAYHNLAIQTNGTLWAWGFNGNGRLGDGTTANKTIPTQIGTATTWSSITTGYSHSLAIQTNGTLWAWGFNGNGRLGDGTTVDKTIPTQIGTATTWSSITAGANHSLAIQTNGTLWAWGYNVFGQLGDGTTANKNSPTAIDCPAVLSASSFNVSDNINLYPNPTNGNVHIMVNNLTNVSVSVYDLNGRQILNKELAANENAVDISNFQTGMYLFKIKSIEGETVNKVIKN